VSIVRGQRQERCTGGRLTMIKKREADLVAEGVDIHNWGPTEPDEEQVLASLGYVLNRQTGIFEGEPRT
jgi:hypothetical protein